MAKRKRRTVSARQMLRSDGALCVSFVNTGRRKPLESYDDLLAWGVETGALGTTDSARLGQLAEERPGVAGGTLRRAQTLRARMERMLLALIAGGKAAKADFSGGGFRRRAAGGAGPPPPDRDHLRLSLGVGRRRRRRPRPHALAGVAVHR